MRIPHREVRLGVIRQRYTAFGGAERCLERAIDAVLERDVAVPKVDRGKLARELKAFTNQLPYVDHRIGDRYKRQGLK